MSKHLLIEIGTEELPPKHLKYYAHSFKESFLASFEAAKIKHGTATVYSTPRRLAIVIESVEGKQEDQVIEKLGPAISAAFDKDNNPTKAALGFAKSNHCDIKDLVTRDTDKGPRLLYASTQKGKNTEELLESFLAHAVKNLPIPKRMRWGNHRFEFSRPVHWLTCVSGDTVIPVELFGKTATGQSFGHRFMANQAFYTTPETYEDDLEKHFVIANFNKRKDRILQQINTLANEYKASIDADAELVDEVTSLVEWPVALMGEFDAGFLEVPKEALISSMKEHQKYFHLLDTQGALLPHFITIANIESLSPDKVAQGNERVIRPRLADAAFFFENDKKESAAERNERLEQVTFQKKLGSIYQKAVRISQLAGYIADIRDFDRKLTERAALLCKSDLASHMVSEFPDLQGIMGTYYSIHEGENEKVSQAIREHYLPKSADDELPATPIGQALALADRIDTLVGIFAIGEQPSGNKDPFALRRASLGILNICIGKQLDLDLVDLFEHSAETYESQGLITSVPFKQALTYTMERLRSFYQAQSIRTEVYLAVAATECTRPVDFDNRIQAVQHFDKQETAVSLASANKRVLNLLAKHGLAVDNSVVIREELLQESAETTLVSSLTNIDADYKRSIMKADYKHALDLASTLKEPVDNFFDTVMVNAEDASVKANRLAILQLLGGLFSGVANIGLLAKS